MTELAPEPAPAAARSPWSRRARVLIALGVLVVLGGRFLPDMKSSFRTWHDVRPGDYLIGSTGQAGVDVMVAITPTAKGQVAMAGFRIRYHVGDRQGSEQAGMDTTVRTVTG